MRFYLLTYLLIILVALHWTLSKCLSFFRSVKGWGQYQGLKIPVNNRNSCSSHSPCKDNEHIESVPSLRQVSLFAKQPHCHDLRTHLDGKECKDEMVEALQQPASSCVAHFVDARLVHAKGYAVEQDDAHADALKPSSKPSQGNLSFLITDNIPIFFTSTAFHWMQNILQLFSASIHKSFQIAKYILKWPYLSRNKAK